ncbi:MAG: polyphenol oxidase family protein [Actinobacteria bacterium]|nr:polyphenol oxidase family protein [Actinomycetota bacterium]
MRFTGRAEGDLGHGGEYVEQVDPAVEARRRAVVDRPWIWLRQVHGDRIVTVDPAGLGAGEVADGSVTREPTVALSVLTADCAPVALAAPEGVIAVVHAGWRGLASGVIARAVEAVRACGGQTVVAAVGPCIHAECYEFGAGDLDAVAAALGDSVRGQTTAGRPALDLPAGVRRALVLAGAELTYDADVCTACAADAYFSHRARQESERQGVVAWLG